MSFRIQCECGAKLTIKDKLAGKTGQCPACSRTVTLIPPMPTHVRWQCPQCERLFSIPADSEPSNCPDCEREAATMAEVAGTIDLGTGHAPLTPQTPPIPKVQKKKWRKRWIGLVVVLIVVGMAALLPLMKGGKSSINPVQSIANSKLQSAVDRATKSDVRNEGIKVSAYYRNAFDKSVIVFDLQEISGSKSRLDVFRLLLDFAVEVQAEQCEWVELALRGRTRFKLEGSYFRQLARERSYQNPAYTIRTFPENLKTPTGGRAYPEWTGGLLGVLNKQMEDFNDFHDKWYLDDLRHTL